jgi:hypothetical protein
MNWKRLLLLGWWQAVALRRHRALTLVCRSESDLGSRVLAVTQPTMDMGIIRMDIIDHIRITTTTQAFLLLVRGHRYYRHHRHHYYRGISKVGDVGLNP